MVIISQRYFPSKEQVMAVIQIQRVCRGYVVRCEFSRFGSKYSNSKANKIQLAYKQSKRRQLSLENFYDYLCSLATEIKMAYRWYKIKLHIADRALAHYHRRVIILQSLYRRRIARKQYNHRYAIMINKMATRICSCARGWTGRNRFKRIRRLQQYYCDVLRCGSFRLSYDIDSLKNRWMLNRWDGLKDILLHSMTHPKDTAHLYDSCYILNNLYPKWTPVLKLLQFFCCRYWSDYGRWRYVDARLLEESMFLLVQDLHFSATDILHIQDMELTMLKAQRVVLKPCAVPAVLFWKSFWTLCFYTPDIQRVKARFQQQKALPNVLTRLDSQVFSNCSQAFDIMYSMVNESTNKALPGELGVCECQAGYTVSNQPLRTQVSIHRIHSFVIAVVADTHATRQAKSPSAVSLVRPLVASLDLLLEINSLLRNDAALLKFISGTYVRTACVYKLRRTTKYLIFVQITYSFCA
jgi:hypothetical protein